MSYIPLICYTVSNQTMYYLWLFTPARFITEGTIKKLDSRHLKTNGSMSLSAILYWLLIVTSEEMDNFSHSMFRYIIN